MVMQKKQHLSTIPLSVRGKKRYILFQVSVENTKSIPKNEIETELKRHMFHCFGVLGLPLHRVRMIAYNPQNSKGVLRCAHTSKGAMITALLAFRVFQGKKASVRTLQTSGTIKTLRPSLERA
jgi:RNase P/RNase MRP subunit POP5